MTARGLPGDDPCVAAVLLEREAELEAISNGLVRAHEGDGCAFLVEGPAGIGKTGVLRAAADVAAAQGFLVLGASGGELERDFPFSVVRQWFERPLMAASATEREALLDGAAGLARTALGLDALEVEPPPPGDPGFFRVTHGLYWLVANLAERTPLVLVLDDAHWADSPSLRFAAYLARRAAELPVVVLAGMRRSEPGADEAVLAELAGGPATHTLRPGPLSRSGVAPLVREGLGGDVADEFAAACHDATGGNPFLLHELLDVLAADGVAGTAATAALVRDIGPHTVSRSVLSRIGRLPAPAAAVAVAAAVLGHDADPARVAVLAAADSVAVDAALSALASIQLLERDVPVRFTHPILRAAVYHDIPPLERSRLHSAAAEMLIDADAGADRVAPHLLATTPAGSEFVVEELREAGRLAFLRGAPDLAARNLRRALEEPPGDEALGGVLSDLGWAMVLTGAAPEPAVEFLERALESDAPAGEMAVRALRYARAAHAVWGSGRPVARLEALIDRLGNQDSEATLLLEVELSALGLLDEATVPRVAGRLERFADASADTLGGRLALSSLAMRRAVWGDGSAAATASLARNAVGLPVEVGGWATSFYEAMGALVICDELDNVVAELTRFVEDARRRGSPFVLCAVSTVRALAHLRGGDLGAAEADARAALEATVFNQSFVQLTYAVLAEVLIERGELDEAGEVLGRAMQPDELPNVLHFNNIFLPRSRLQRMRGDVEAALAELRELEAREARLSLRNPYGRWRAEAAELAGLLGHAADASRWADEAMQIAVQWDTAGAKAMALRARGMVVRGAEGLDALRSAAVLSAESPQHLEHARTLFELGAALRRAGSRSEATAPLTEALELARRCGSTTLAERAHGELSLAGARPRRLQFSGVESLTAAERRVCEMAASGQANRAIAQALFVTAKTVENHLGRAYGKLGITSRRELAEALSSA